MEAVSRAIWIRKMIFSLIKYVGLFWMESMTKLWGWSEVMVYKSLKRCYRYFIRGERSKAVNKGMLLSTGTSRRTSDGCVLFVNEESSLCFPGSKRKEKGASWKGAGER